MAGQLRWKGPVRPQPATPEVAPPTEVAQREGTAKSHELTTLGGLAALSLDALSSGGDTFDYSLDREYLYVSLTDAMGHSTHAALLATLAVGTLRNRRRALATPAEQADAADAEMLANASPDQFVTGLIAGCAWRTGTSRLSTPATPPLT